MDCAAGFTDHSLAAYLIWRMIVPDYSPHQKLGEGISITSAVATLTESGERDSIG
jgi:hypothetical protein